MTTAFITKRSQTFICSMSPSPRVQSFLRFPHSESLVQAVFGLNENLRFLFPFFFLACIGGGCFCYKEEVFFSLRMMFT